MIYDHMKSKALFNWLRKKFEIEKPTALPICHYSEDDMTWEDWNEKIRKEKPFGYFVTETLPGFIDKIRGKFKNPFDDIQLYIINRFNSKTHYLQTGLTPGKYYEIDTRILHALFETLVEFVESELAWFHTICDKEAEKSFPPDIKGGLFTSYKNKAAGIAHLEWESSLVFDEDMGCTPDDPNFGKPTAQALAAKEILELYRWWTITRPNRVNMWDEYTSFIDETNTKYPSTAKRLFDYDEVWTVEEKAEKDARIKLAMDFDDMYKQEDDEMLIRLVKIRGSLWT